MKVLVPATLGALFEGFEPDVVNRLKNLASPFLSKSVSSVTSDSRQMVAGCVFVAVRGGTRDGHDFIPAAVQAGVALIVGEIATPAALEGSKIPYLQVSDSRWALSRIASNFYGNPSHSLKMIGVTGTSGKTTTTYIIESVLKASGHGVGVLGTVNFRFGTQIFPSTHTTPGPVELQALLAQMKAAGCTAVVMEVSSHALKQGRSACIAFDAMVFNNLSPEHLDFHPDMEDYYQSKKLLFTRSADDSIAAGKKPVACIHRDDSFGGRLWSELQSDPRLRVLSFGLDPANDVSGSALTFGLDGIHGQAAGVAVDAKLTGRFNAQNLLGAVAAGLGLGASTEEIARGLRELQTVPGRLERVPNDKGIQVLVDYAHKPDALEKVLKTLQEVKNQSRIFTVFGCGGDRDRTKRPVMGRIAAELSDHAFVTSDNPRKEDPQAIIDEIVAGMSGFQNFTVEPDRERAILAAIHSARPGDLVLIAGKGHEDYQIISDPSSPEGTRKVHFDDREVASKALESVRFA